MAQKLILPINNTRITSGFKNETYRKQFGYRHFGQDMTDKDRKDYTVWGCGNGEVLEAAYDDKTGWTLIIRYNDCILADGTVRDIIQRSWHFDKLLVKKGQKISKDTRVGYYGDTGAYAEGKHLHIEFDSDVKYPAYSPSFAGNTTIIKAGTDTTIDPVKVLYVKASKPDYQSVIGSAQSNCWTNKDIQFKQY